MANSLRLTAVLAHPDDESLALGGVLAKYAAEGVETSLVVATRGQRGWPWNPARYPGPVALGRIREEELYRAAGILGIGDVVLLDEMDGEVSTADPAALVGQIAAHLRSFRPQVVVTFGPDGAYGHPDHIAVSQLTAAAIARAADPAAWRPDGAPPHRVGKLYHRIWTGDEAATYLAAVGDVVLDVDGDPRRWVSWPDWSVTTRVDTADHWQTVVRAVACHRSQLPTLPVLLALPPERQRALWGVQQFVRVMSLVNGGHARETDLFAGLRRAAPEELPEAA